MFSANVPPSTAGCCTEKEEVKAASYRKLHMESAPPPSKLQKGFTGKGPLGSVSGSSNGKVKLLPAGRL